MQIRSEVRIVQLRAEVRIVQQHAEVRVIQLQAEVGVVHLGAEVGVVHLGAEVRVVQQGAEVRIVHLGAEVRVVQPLAEIRVVQHRAEIRVVQFGAEVRIVQILAEVRIVQIRAEIIIAQRLLESGTAEDIEQLWIFHQYLEGVCLHKLGDGLIAKNDIFTSELVSPIALCRNNGSRSIFSARWHTIAEKHDCTADYDQRADQQPYFCIACLSEIHLTLPVIPTSLLRSKSVWSAGLILNTPDPAISWSVIRKKSLRFRYSSINSITIT